MSERRVFKQTIPVDDQDHSVEMLWTAEPLAVVADKVDEVVFWHEDIGKSLIHRTFRVFGTGQPIPPGYEHKGTAMHSASKLVWHLFENVARPDSGSAPGKPE